MNNSPKMVLRWAILCKAHRVGQNANVLTTIEVAHVDISLLRIFRYSAYPRLCGAPHNRGFRPSCAGRCMAQTAAHLVERMIPWVPTRQWVVSVPVPLRYWVAASQ